MPRMHASAVRLDEDALCRLNRLRRGTQQPLSRIVNAIVRDYLDDFPAARRTRSRGRQLIASGDAD